MTHIPLVKINVVAPLGGGKSTIARKLEKFFKKEGCNVSVNDFDTDSYSNKGDHDISDRFVLIETTNNLRNAINETKKEQIEMKDNHGNITHGYVRNGIFVRHRDNDFPSVECVDGRKEWYSHGELHREGVPAVTFDNVGMYFINGINVSDEVKDWLDERNLNVNTMTYEDKLALSFFMRSLVQV